MYELMLPSVACLACAFVSFEETWCQGSHKVLCRQLTTGSVPWVNIIAHCSRAEGCEHC